MLSLPHALPLSCAECVCIPDCAQGNVHLLAFFYRRLAMVERLGGDDFGAAQARRDARQACPCAHGCQRAFDDPIAGAGLRPLIDAAHLTDVDVDSIAPGYASQARPEEHTSELQSLMRHLVCRLMLEKTQL